MWVYERYAVINGRRRSAARSGVAQQKRKMLHAQRRAYGAPRGLRKRFDIIFIY